MSAEQVNTQAPPNKIPAQPPKETAEKQTNCLGCGKPIRKLIRYYRNGKFYCNKKCWKTAMKKSKEAKS